MYRLTHGARSSRPARNGADRSVTIPRWQEFHTRDAAETWQYRCAMLFAGDQRLRLVPTTGTLFPDALSKLIQY